MTIIADTSIPNAAHVFGRWGDVSLIDSEDITGARVASADAILVRSVTRVNEQLLRGSSVRFVGSATIGVDHVDVDWLRKEGIAFAHAPGSNAESVVEYVLSALLATIAHRGDSLDGLTVGVVGRGNVGARLEQRLRSLGLMTLVNDPPLAEINHDGELVTLTELLESADIVTLHCPLTTAGPHPTRHLIGEEALERMRPSATLVNTARGSVVDNRALLHALGRGRIRGAILDVWEGEPVPLEGLVEACDLATPHIAGYSIDGKNRGTLMLGRRFAAWMGETADPAWQDPIDSNGASLIELEPPQSALASDLDVFVRQMYDVRQDDAAMRQLLGLSEEERAAAFIRLRREYPDRYSFGRYAVRGTESEEMDRMLAEGLGVTVLPRVTE